jgi:hypothetical protein
MTVNQVHFMKNRSFLKGLVEQNLIYGLGVSLVRVTNDFIDALKEFPNAVIHVINGLVNPLELEALSGEGLKILILGYKQFRRGKDLYEKRVNLTISGYGELVLRARAGQIRHADNPVIVYEGDTFQFGEQNGHKVVNYMSAFPRTSNKIIACFMKITRADGSVDYAVMTEADWKRLERYSFKNNGSFRDKSGNMVARGANELYQSDNGQIDTGFLIAKCIKHAFKTYPKLKIGKGMMLESEMPELQEQQDGFDPYGGVESQAPAKQEAFGPAVDTSTGVIIEEENKGEYDGAF